MDRLLKSEPNLPSTRAAFVLPPTLPGLPLILERQLLRPGKQGYCAIFTWFLDLKRKTCLMCNL